MTILGKASKRPIKMLPTARDYIQDSVFLFIDGIENVGWGLHENGRVAWINLITGKTSATLSEYCEFGDDSLMHSLGGAGAILTSAHTTRYKTIEVVFRVENGIFQGQAVIQAPLIGWGVDSQAYSIGVYANYTKVQTGKIYGNTLPLSTPISRYVRQSIAFTKNELGQDLSSFTNGMDKSAPAYVQDYYSFGSSIMGGNAQRNMEGEICCIRAHSRILTAEEIAYNYAIDKARFGLP